MVATFLLKLADAITHTHWKSTLVENCHWNVITFDIKSTKPTTNATTVSEVINHNDA